jgi:hypothetical protein
MKHQVKKVSGYLQKDVDLQRCNPISLYSCFLSGFTSCISFSVSRVSVLIHILFQQKLIIDMLYLVWISNVSRIGHYTDTIADDVAVT